MVTLLTLPPCPVCSESNVEESGLWHVAGPPRHLCVLFCSEDMGGAGGTLSAPDRMEGQLGWSQIRRTAGQRVNIYTVDGSCMYLETQPPLWNLLLPDPIQKS